MLPRVQARLHLFYAGGPAGQTKVLEPASGELYFEAVVVGRWDDDGACVCSSLYDTQSC